MQQFISRIYIHITQLCSQASFDELSGSGRGFQGRHLAERLVKNGEHVRILDKNAVRAGFSGADLERVEWITGDFCSPNTLAQVLQGVDVIFHLISTLYCSAERTRRRHQLIMRKLPARQTHAFALVREASTESNQARRRSVCS